MKGVQVYLDAIEGRAAAARLRDGQLDDLLIDPVASDRPVPGAIYRAVVERSASGQGGVFVGLGNGHRAFVRQGKGLATGSMVLAQITNWGDGDKAASATSRILFKSRYAIVTPAAPGLNVARSIRNEEERGRLHDIAATVEDTLLPTAGLILRSGCKNADSDAIAADARAMALLCADVESDGDGTEPALLVDGPSAHLKAWQSWSDVAEGEVFDTAGCFETDGIIELIEELRGSRVGLGNAASMIIEPTAALVAVDINTGADFSLAAGLKANLAAVRDMPRQLRLRGLGGQIVIDAAPMPKKHRRDVEQALARALKSDTTDTVIAGWTPLGHLELQRKRDRLPLTEVFGV